MSLKLMRMPPRLRDGLAWFQGARSVYWLWVSREILIAKIGIAWIAISAIGGVALLTWWGWYAQLPGPVALLVALGAVAALLVILVFGLAIILWTRESWRNRRQWFDFRFSMEGPGQVHLRVTNNGPQDEVSLQVACIRGAYGGSFLFPIQIGWDESNAVHAKIAKHDSRTAHIGKAEIQWREDKGQSGEIPTVIFAFRTPGGERLASQSPAFSGDKRVGHIWELEFRAVALLGGRASTCRAFVYLAQTPTLRIGTADKSPPGFDAYLAFAHSWENVAKPQPWPGDPWPDASD